MIGIPDLYHDRLKFALSHIPSKPMNSDLLQTEHRTRRTWVKQFMLASVTALTGSRWAGTALADVTSTGPGPAVIRLKPSSIEAISTPGGSVQLIFIEYLKPFTLNRVTTDQFVTLDTVCTHAGCTVGRYQEHVVSENPRVTASYMLCPCHGSRFDLEGRVVEGPAEEDLVRFETSYDAETDIVSITIPGLKLHINTISVHQRGPGESIRLKLDFPVTGYAKYQIFYQPDLASPPVLAPFSTTPGGAATQTVLTPFSNVTTTVYVDASGARGFFSVGLVLDAFS
jgi:Rieske Fe-S protein